MTAWLTVAGWCLTAGLLGARDRRRLAHAARTRHEVRGPLCTARLALDGLEPSARVDAIDLELRRAALALDELVEGRSAAGRVEPVALGRLLREAEAGWTALAAAHGATLTLAAPPRDICVAAEPLRVLQACANLVANAAEHGGGAVTVTVIAANAGSPAPGRRAVTDRDARPGAPARVRIEVSDQGPGLPAALPTLLAAARGRRSSRGHGLAIVASIAERHGGRLGTAPCADGARLVLELPAAAPFEAPP